MFGKKIAFIVAIPLLSLMPIMSASAQVILGPDKPRNDFAFAKCGGNQWELRGYNNFQDCYDDYYNSYPNEPFGGDA